MMTMAEALALAARHYHAGQLAPAEQLCRQIVKEVPGNAYAWHLLGLLAYQVRRWDEALDCYRRALRLRPDLAEVHNSQGAALIGCGRWEEALQSIQQSLRLQPNNADAHHNQGIILQQLGRWQEAEASYLSALRLRPHFPQAHKDLSVLLDAQSGLLLGQGQFAEAEARCRAALRHDPENPRACDNLGLALTAQEKLDEAVACYQHALRIAPNQGIVHNNLAIALATQGKTEEAIACFRRAAALTTDVHYVQSNYLFALHYTAAHDPEAIFSDHVRWGQKFVGREAWGVRREEFTPHAARGTPRDPERRLRIGYFSADFRDHVVGRYCEGVLRAHDRGQVEVFCYSSVSREDTRTQRIKELADHWRCLVPLSDAEVAGRILKDKIDLLIDLSGHSASNRLPVFARKPAPIQVSHFGYPASTGLAAIDYRLTDAYFDPPGMTEHLYSEKLVRMPEACWCYVPWDSPEIGPLPAERPGAVTFASISTLNKMTEEVVALWAQILRELPESRMLVVTGAGRAGDEQVRSAFARQGVGPERVALVGRQRFDAYLRLFDDVDIVLDTYPYTGMNTTADALWMGVPVVTRAGRSCVSRLAVAPLMLAGLGDLISASAAAYVEAAVQLALDVPRLRELRGQLRDRVKRTLGDVERFTRQLEAAYREMWKTYCEQVS